MNDKTNNQKQPAPKAVPAAPERRQVEVAETIADSKRGEPRKLPNGLTITHF